MDYRFSEASVYGAVLSILVGLALLLVASIDEGAPPERPRVGADIEIRRSKHSGTALATTSSIAKAVSDE